jgi:hypothetical protein
MQRPCTGPNGPRDRGTSSQPTSWALGLCRTGVQPASTVNGNPYRSVHVGSAGIGLARAGAQHGKTGAAATAAVPAGRSGARSRSRGKPCAGRRPAVIAKRDAGASRGLRRLSDIITPHRSCATQAMHHPAHRVAPLYRRIGSQEWRQTALQGVLATKGSRTPGGDGITREDRSSADAQYAFGQEIEPELRERSVRPAPVRRGHSPQGQGKDRPLGISPSPQTEAYSCCARWGSNRSGSALSFTAPTACGLDAAPWMGSRFWTATSTNATRTSG